MKVSKNRYRLEGKVVTRWFSTLSGQVLVGKVVSKHKCHSQDGCPSCPTGRWSFDVQMQDGLHTYCYTLLSDGEAIANNPCYSLPMDKRRLQNG